VAMIDAAGRSREQSSIASTRMAPDSYTPSATPTFESSVAQSRPITIIVKAPQSDLLARLGRPESTLSARLNTTGGQLETDDAHDATAGNPCR